MTVALAQTHVSEFAGITIAELQGLNNVVRAEVVVVDVLVVVVVVSMVVVVSVGKVVGESVAYVPSEIPRLIDLLLRN